MSIQFKEVVHILTHFNTTVKKGTKKVNKLVDSKYTEFGYLYRLFFLLFCTCQILGIVE